jgi:hypothetical protein
MTFRPGPPHIRHPATTTLDLYAIRSPRPTNLQVRASGPTKHQDREPSQAARQRLAAGQGDLDLGLQPAGAAGGPLPVSSSRMVHRLDALERVYQVLGLEQAAGDEVSRHLAAETVCRHCRCLC